jgi:hypothetical protein
LNELFVKLNSVDPRGIQLTPTINEIQLLMYADDIAIFADTIGGLQRKINILQEYCDEWNLSVNLKKTQVVVFKNGGAVSRNEKWLFKGHKLETVSYYKYLGLTISCRNKWSKNVENLVSQTSKVGFQLNRYLKTVGNLPYHVFFKLFNTIVIPTVCYGAEIWGYSEYYTLNCMQAKLCTRFLGLSSKASNLAAVGECGQISIFVQTATQCIKYWLHILKLENYRYPKHVYNMLHHYDNCNIHTWASEIKLILCKSGFGHVWYFQGVGNDSLFIQSFKQRLKVELYFLFDVVYSMSNTFNK